MSKNKSRPLPGADLVQRELSEVEAVLSREARSEVRLVLDVGSHILGSGGKRFRPLLTLLAGKLVGMRRKKELINYAAGMEFSHTSTLLHDDVIDEADLRRGTTSANREWGNAPSIIVGDYLLFKSFSLMLASGNREVMKLISDVAIEMAEGEAYQLAQKSRVDLSEDQYEKIIRAKTALLIQAACHVPSIAAGSDKRKQSALKRFGYRLGLAFQITDDLLDYSAEQERLGKAVGKDFMEGKATLPLILAFHNASQKDRQAIKRMFNKKSRTRKELDQAIRVIRRNRGMELSKDRARRHVEAAKKSLGTFPQKPAKEALFQLADYVVQRSR